MIDHFLEIACREDQRHAARNEMAENFKALPVEELYKLASGELKLADCCGDDDWLSKFKATPLYSQALSLEEQLLQLDVADQQRRLSESAQHEQESAGSRQIYDAKDGLRLKKKMLELELRKLELQEQGAGAGVPAEGAPPPASGAPPPTGGMSPPVSAPEAPQGKIAGLSEKRAFMGIGIDIPVGSEAKDSKSNWHTAINVGFPHGVAAVRRHRESGLGVGLGLTGPQVSIRLAGKSSGEKKAEARLTAALMRKQAFAVTEKDAEFEAADACGRLLAKEAAGGAAGLLTGASAMGGKALDVGRRLWSGIGGAGQTGAMVGAGLGGIGGAATGLQKDQQGHRSLLKGAVHGVAGAATGGALGAAGGLASKNIGEVAKLPAYKGNMMGAVGQGLKETGMGLSSLATGG